MENNVLHRMYPAKLLTSDQHVNNVLMILTDKRMTPMGLLLATLSQQAKYKPYKDTFYHSNTNAINCFWNIVDAERWGNDKLKSWLDV